MNLISQKPAISANDEIPVGDLEAEHIRSIKEYGNWDGLTYPQMIQILRRELREVCQAVANNDLDGEHGIYSEAVQVANCAMKIAVQARKRKT